MRVIFIVNEFAGNGKGKQIWQALQAKLTIDYEVYVSQHKRHSEQLAREIATANVRSFVFIVGGDGSVHEVLNGLVGAQHVTIGVVSAGSGNDFARYYGAFKTAREIETYLTAQQWSVQDIGVLQVEQKTRYFVNNSGLGFDAFVVDLANRSQLKKNLNRIGLGKLSYAYFVVQGLFQFQPFDLQVVIDGQQVEYKQVWFATVCNQPYFGGGMKLSPQSFAADSLLELTVVNGLPRWKFLTFFSTVFFGKHTYFREIEQRAGKQFALTVKQAVPCHTDGEPIILADAEQTLFVDIKEKAWSLAKNMR